MKLKNCILLCTLLATLLACGDDDQKSAPANNHSDNHHNHVENNHSENNDNNHAETNNDAENNDNNEDENNVVVVNNVNNDPVLEIECFEELLDAWPLNEGVNEGEVAVTAAGSEFTGTIDASAGGTMSAPSSSFVYVDLDTGNRVDVDDFAAYENTEWDLAFKRVVIKTNSANSGPGHVEVARLADTAFAEASLTGATMWASDQTMDDACIPDFDPVGNPITAFNLLNLDNPTGSESWYAYGQMGVSPQADVYLVKNADASKTYKFEIQGWASGEFAVRWAEVSE